MSRRIKLTSVSILHYIRLVYRSILFLTVFFVYAAYRLLHHGSIVGFFDAEEFIEVLKDVEE